MGSPASRRATNLTLSSITEHSFHGIHFPPRKGRKCNLCVRYDLLPMSRVAHSNHLTQIGVAQWEALFRSCSRCAHNCVHSADPRRRGLHLRSSKAERSLSVPRTTRSFFWYVAVHPTP